MPPYGFGDGMAGEGSLCMQLSPLNHHEEGIKKVDETYFVYGVVRPRGSFRFCPPILFNLRHRSDW